MTDSIDTSEREAEEPAFISLPVREMSDEPAPQQTADALRTALQLALEATPEQLPAALDALRDQLGLTTSSPPCAMRYDFDGHGWRYIDAGSGSDWMTRVPGAEPVYDGPTKQARWVQGVPDDACRPDILERLTYHALERDDLTLDDCLSYLANGWREVHGRTERNMVMQILSLLASAPQASKCPTCNDNGLVGGPSFYAPDEGGVPCPDCSQPSGVQQATPQEPKHRDHTALLQMLAKRARSFPTFPLGYHIPEVFTAVGETPPDPGQSEGLEREPAARVAEIHMSRYTIEWLNGPLPEGTLLYAPPAPQAERTALEQYDLDQSEDYRKGWNDGRMKGFTVGFRFGKEQAAVEEPVLTTCNCRWDGEKQVQQCTLHEAHIDAIHEWAERAKTAEAKLSAQQAKPQPDDHFPDAGEMIGAQDEPNTDLMSFYGVDSLAGLVKAQARHIEKLQSKLPNNDMPSFSRVREG